jgi:hypothetical protein
LEIKPDIKIAEPTIKVIKEVKRDAGRRKEGSVLAKEKSVKLSIEGDDSEKSGR